MRISDWSSDVCSSDLEREVTDRRDMLKLAGAGLLGTGLSGFGAPGLAATAAAAPGAPGPAPTWTKGFDGQRKADLGDGRFLNPIMAGDHPDPSILKDGADYYMTFSTFRSEEHTSELQSLMRISYAVFCLKKKTTIIHH